MHKKEIVSHSLYDLYKIMGLPLGAVDPKSGFTAHFLKETFTELPFTSIAYRPDYFSFTFVRNGHGKYIIDELTYPIKPGTVYFTNPGNFRQFEWYDITDVFHITFKESFLKAYVHDDVYKDFSFLLTETVQPRVLQPIAFDDIELLYQQIYKEQNADSPYKNRIIASLFVVLLLKIKEYFWQDYNPIYEGDKNSQIVKVFKQNLESHFRNLVQGKAENPLRVQDYANMQSLHPNYLTTVIKTKTGKSIGAWIAEKTTAAAKSLLQNSLMSIKEIAYRLGFTETAHFSNHFKKNTKFSPAEYRKDHQS